MFKVDMEQMNFRFKLWSYSQDIAHFVNAYVPKSENIINLKHFWSKAFQIRDSQPVSIIF